MRKRSEVAAKKAVQTTLDAAPTVAKEESPVSGKVIRYFTCTCGLKQSDDIVAQNKGACLRCLKPIDLGKPSEVQPIRTATPGILSTRPAEHTDVAFNELADALVKKGYIVSLTGVAAWTPEQRSLAREWAAGKSFVEPTFLKDHRGRRLSEEDKTAMKSGLHASPGPEAGPDPLNLSGKPPPLDLEGHAKRLGTMTKSGEFPVTIVNNSGPAPKVVYTWPEEMIRIAEYNTVRVGPYSAEAYLQPGEDPASVLARLADSVIAFAETERSRKIQSYVECLTGEVKPMLKAMGGA
jgi:hypothetical protein